MTRNYKMIAGLVLAGLFLGAGLASAQEAQGCNAQTVKGSYGWRAAGSFPNQPGAFAAVGVLTFDGEGKVSATEVASFNGPIVRVTWKGTYSVNQDCTVSARITVEGYAGTYQIDFVFADNGKEFVGMQTDPQEAVITFVGKRL